QRQSCHLGTGARQIAAGGIRAVAVLVDRGAVGQHREASALGLVEALGLGADVVGSEHGLDLGLDTEGGLALGIGFLGHRVAIDLALGMLDRDRDLLTGLGAGDAEFDALVEEVLGADLGRIDGQSLLGSGRFLLVLGSGAGRPGGLGRLAFGLFVLGTAGAPGVLVGLRSLALGSLGLVVVFGVSAIVGLHVVVRRAFVVGLGVVGRRALVIGLGVIARGLLGRARVEAPGAVLVVVGLRRTRSARFRRLLGFGLRGLRRVGLGRSLRRRLGIRRCFVRSLRCQLRGISIVGRRGGLLTVVIAGRIVDCGVVGDDLEGHRRGVGLGLEVGEVERVLPDGDLGVLGHGEVVRAGHLTLLIDRELLLRRVFGAIGADNGDSGLLVRGESGSGDADSLLLVRDVGPGHLRLLKGRLWIRLVGNRRIRFGVFGVAR